MTAAERLAAASAGVGAPLGRDELDALAVLVDRVEGGLGVGTPVGPSAALGEDPGGSGPAGGVGDASAGAGSGDDPAGPWVWRAERSAGPAGDGPLAGWRLAVKDLIAVAGRPVRAGSRARAGARPEPADAPVVAALRSAGAEVVGVVKLHEFAFGVTGLNAWEGTPANPAAPGRVPGGSSSGSAVAVARGEADVALGSDTGGSCRIPAALCGVVGYKPAFGLVPTAGVWPLAPTLDHVGWLTDRADRLRAVAEVLGVVASSSGLAGMALRRLGVARAALADADETVGAAFEDTLDRLTASGLELVEVDWPSAEEAFAPSTAIMYCEAAFGHRALLAERAEDYGVDIRNRLLQGAAMGLSTYLRAREAQDRLRARCRAVLADVDAVISPTVAVVPPTVESAAADPAVGARLVAATRLANLTGLPAVSVPIPGTPLPVGLQLEAGNDALTIDGAVRVERALRG